MTSIDTIQAGYLIELEELRKENVELKDEQRELIEELELLSKKVEP